MPRLAIVDALIEEERQRKFSYWREKRQMRLARLVKESCGAVGVTYFSIVCVEGYEAEFPK